MGGASRTAAQRMSSTLPVRRHDSDIPLSRLTWTVPTQTYLHSPYILTTVALGAPWLCASSTVTPKDMGHFFTSCTYLNILLIRHRF